MEKKAESVKTAVKQANQAEKFFCAYLCGKLPVLRQRNPEYPEAGTGCYGESNRAKNAKKEPPAHGRPLKIEKYSKNKRKCLTSDETKWYNKALIYRKMETLLFHSLALLYHECVRESRCLDNISNNKTVCIVFLA